ncbi:MAG: DUF6638 family protein, partial [Nanoarchaeota archaeon]
VEVSLDSLDKIVGSVGELSKLSDKLDEDDKALNPEYIGRMQELVRKVGDIRNRAISNVFPIKREVHCFYVEFFRGVHCLRNFGGGKVKAIFVTNNQQKSREYGPEIINLDIHDKDLLDILHKHEFLDYKPELVGQRILDIEDEVLLSEGKDIVDMRKHERKREIYHLRGKLPETYNQLCELQNILESGNKKGFSALMKQQPYGIKLMLADGKEKREIINHLLADLDSKDPIRLYEFNRKRLIAEFHDRPLNRQRYSAFRLMEYKMKGGKK